MDHKVWTEEDIRKVLKEASKKINYDCSHVPIVISKKLTSVGGYFQANTENKKIYKGANSFTFSYYLSSGVLSEECFRQIILHEYCHFVAIDSTKKLRGHDKVFKEYCSRVGCNIPTATTTMVLYEDVNKFRYTISCGSCGIRFGEMRIEKNYKELYCCSVCGGEFKIIKNW